LLKKIKKLIYHNTAPPQSDVLSQDNAPNPSRTAASHAKDRLKTMQVFPGNTLRKKSDLTPVSIMTLYDKQASEAMAVLQQAIQSDDPSLNTAAIDILRRFEEPEAIELIVKCMCHDNEEIQRLARDAIMQRSSVAIPVLVTLLNSDDSKIQRLAIQLVGELKARTAEPRLVKLLVAQTESENYPLGAQIVRSLEQIGTPSAIDATEQWRAKHGSSHAIFQKLLHTLRDPRWGEREEAAKALREYCFTLGKEHNHFVVQELQKLLEEDDWVIRWAAIESLAWTGAADSAPSIANYLTDSSWTVRIAALRALGELKNKNVIPDIRKCLHDENRMVVEVCLEVLGELSDHKEIPHIAALLHTEDPFIRLAVLSALSNLDHEEALAYLVQSLDDSDVHVRWVALNLLITHANDAMIGKFAELLHDQSKPFWEEKRICDLAEIALAHIGDAKSTDALKNWRLQQKNM